MTVALSRSPAFALLFWMLSMLPSVEAELSEASGKYYEMLRQRPESEVVFDRFYDGWFEEASLGELERFLREASQAEQATSSDFRILASFYQRQGDEASALRVLERAFDAEKASAALWLERARMEWALLDFDGAAHSLKQALALNLPEASQIEARRLWGAVHARLGQMEQAQTVWMELMEDYPGERELMEDLIDLQIGEGLLEEALATARQLVQQTSEPYQWALYQLWVGDILQRKGEWAAALELYGALIDRVGNGSWLEREVLAELGSLLANYPDEVDALEFYTNLSARFPQRLEIRQERLRWLAASGQIDAAVAAFQEILRLAPGERRQREAYVSLLRQHGRLTAALRELNKLCDSYPDDAELQLQRVELLAQTDDAPALKQAIASFAQSVGSTPEARLRVARLYAGFELMQEAGAIYAALAEAYPDDVELVKSYALWLYGQEQQDQGRQLMLDLAEQQGRDGLLRLAQTMVSLGESETAYAWLKRRLSDFRQDAIFLHQICQLAMANDAANEALPWVRTLVMQADSPLAMSRAVQLAAQLARQAQVMDTLILELQEAAGEELLGLPGLCLLAELEESQGDSRASEVTLASLRAVGGSIALSEEVRLFENRRQAGPAIAALRKLIELPGQENPLNLSRLVGMLAAERQWDSALAAIDRWKRISPGDPQVWMRESEMLEAAGQVMQAQQQMRRAVYKFDGNTDLALRLAALLKQTQQYVDAERIYWRMYEAGEASTERLRWLDELALVARESGRVLEYVKRLESMRKANRRSLLPLLAMANLYRLENDLPRLLATLQEAERLQPDNREVLDQLIAVYEMLGEYEQAGAGLRRMVALNSTDANRRRLVNFLMRTGEQKAAFALIKAGSTGGAPDAAHLESFIDLLMKSGEWKLAESEAVTARRQFPKDWRIGYQLAVCYVENFKQAEAFDLLLELWHAREPLDRLPPSTQAQGMARYLDGLPPASREIMLTLQQKHGIFSYQRPAASQARYATALSAKQFLHLPEDLASLHRAVVLHLSSLAADLAEAPRQQAIARMSAAGISHPGFYVSMQGAHPNHSNWIQSLVSYVEQHPEQVEFLPILAQYIGYRSKVVLSKESARLGWETYAEDYPQLGIRFALHLMQLDPGNASQYIDQLLDKLGQESWAEHAQYEMMAVGQLLQLINRDSGQRVEFELNAAQRGRIRELAEANHVPAKLLAGNPQLVQVYSLAFQVLVVFALESGDSSAFIELLETHLEAWETYGYPRISQMQQAHLRHRRVEAFDLKVPGFSVLHSGFTTDNIAALFIKARPRQHHPMAQLMQGERFEQFDALELGQHLDAIEHPRLQFLAAWWSGDGERCAQILRELTEGESPRIEDLKLLALWQHNEMKDTRSALHTLERARTFAGDRSVREELDQLVVAMALTLPDGTWVDAEANPLHPVVASAALRLRPTARRNPAQMQLLANAMRNLNMEADASLLEESIQRMASASTRHSSTAPRPAHARAALDPFARMEAFVQQGKTAAAVRLAVSQLRPLLAQATHSRNSLSSPVQRIQKAKLADQVLERFDPKGSRSRRHLESYALLLDAFGRQQEAAEIWRQLQAMWPEEPVYALEVALRSDDEAATAAIRQLLTLRPYPHIDEDIGSWLVQAAQHSQQLRLDQWVRLLEISVQVVDSFEPSPAANINLSWAPYLAMRFARITRIEDQQYPNLIERQRPGRSTKQPEGHAERSQQRSKVFEAFCRAMLRHPQTAQEAFELLFLLRSFQDGAPWSNPELKAAAVAAALMDAQYKPPPMRLKQSVQRWAFIGNRGRVYSSDDIESLHPLVFLARLAKRGGEVDLGVLAQEIAAHDPLLAADLQAVAALLAADDTQFPALFRQWVATEASELRLSFLPEIFSPEGVTDPALQGLLEYGQAQLGETPAHQQLDLTLCTRIATILAHQGRIDLLDQWFDQIFSFYLGPKGGWGAKIAAYTPRGRYATGVANQELLRAWQLARQLCEERDLVLPLVRYTRDSGIGMQAYSTNRLRQDLANGFDDVAAALEWCERQKLLNQLEHFDPLIILDAQRLQQGLPSDRLPDNRNVLVYATALRKLSFRDDPDSEKKKQFLAELKERGFGGHILAAFVEGRSKGRTTALAALDREASAFVALPESRQQAIAYLFKYWIRDGQTADGDPAIVAHLQQIWLAEMRAEAAAYLNLDIPLTDQTYRSEPQLLRKWLAFLIWEEPELAAQIYLHWLEREAAFIPTTRQLSSSQRRSNNENVCRAVFSQTLRSARALESLNQYFAFIAAHHPEGARPIALQDLRRLRSVLEYRLRDATDASNPNLDQILEVLPGIMPGEAASEHFVAVLGLFDYMLYDFRYSENDVDSIRATLSQEDRGNMPYLRWLRAALLARMGEEHADRAAAHFAQILSDTDVPVQIRLSLWMSALQKSPQQWAYQPALAGPGGALMGVYLEKSFPLLDQSFSDTLKQLRPAFALKAWQTALRELLPGLADALPVRVDPRDEQMAQDLVVSIIQLALELDEIEAARSVIQEHFNLVRSDSRILLAMLTAGQIDEAVRLTPPDGAFDASKEMRYTRELHAQLPAYLARIANPAVRYTLEVNLSLLPDAPDLGESSTPDRTARGDSLLQAFPPHKKDPRAVEHLNHLSRYVSDRAVLGRYASDLLAGRSLVGLITNSRQGSRDERGRAKAALDLYGLTLRAAPAGQRQENLLARLGLTPGVDYDDQVWRFLRQRQQQLSSAFLVGLESAGRPEFLEFVPESRAMLEILLQSGRELPNDEASQAFFIYFISHIGAGSSEQIGTDLSETCLPNLRLLQSQWATPEDFLKKIIRWVGIHASQTPRRQAAVGLLLSDHAQLDAVWSTSPRALSHALLGHIRMKRDRDLEAVLSKLDQSSHPRAVWIRFLLREDSHEQNATDLAEMIRFYTPSDAISIGPSVHRRKLHQLWKTQMLDPDASSTSLDYAWQGIQEVVDLLGSEAERNWAAVTLYYFMRSQRSLKKLSETDDAWVERKMRSESIIDRMCLLGLLYRDNPHFSRLKQIPAPLKQILMAILDDTSLPFHLRYQLCIHGTQSPFHRLMDQDVYRALSKLLIEFGEQADDLYDSGWTRKNLDQFFEAKLGEALVPDIRKMLRVLNQAVLDENADQPDGEAASLVPALSRLSLRFGETEQIPALVAIRKDSKWIGVEYIMWLIRREMYDLAKTLLEQHDMLKNFRYQYGYDATLHANLPAFLECYDSPAARYRLEAIFASVEDSTYFPLPDALPDRRVRCRDLLARFEAYADHPDAAEILDRITIDDDLEQEAASLLAQISPARSMEPLLQAHCTDNFSHAEISLFTKHLANRVRAGELEQVDAELKVLVATQKEQSDYSAFIENFEQLQLKLIRCFIDDAGAGDRGRLIAWMSLIETSGEVYQDWRMSARTNNSTRQFLFYQMAMGAAPLSGVESIAFLESPAYQKFEKSFQLKKIRGLTYLKDALGNGSTERERERLLTALRLLLQNESFLDSYWTDYPWRLTNVLRFVQPFKRTALIKVLPGRIAAGSKYTPWYAYLLADYSYAPRNETEAAIKWYQRARESALASEVKKFRTTAGTASLRLAELWKEEPNGAARALDLLEATPDDAFSEGPRRKLKVLRETLGAEAN